jgi:hypothetical protein
MVNASDCVKNKTEAEGGSTIQRRSAERLLKLDKTTEMSMRNKKCNFLPLFSTDAQPIQSTKQDQHPPCIAAILYRKVVLEVNAIGAPASLVLTIGVLNRRTAKPAHKTSAPSSNSVMRS